MKYTRLGLQTHRENPANARSQGQALLVRAGYLSHGGQILPLGERALERIRAFFTTPDAFRQIGLPVLGGAPETCYPSPAGLRDLLFCPGCRAAARAETARAKKESLAPEPPAALERISTPDCPTIESLATFLGISQQKTAKALMFVREVDRRFVFVVIRGDTTLSQAKLTRLVGEVRLANETEIRAVGAVPGYASPLGVRNALIVVDELIPPAPNLAAGANETGYHLKNVNYGRDYRAELIADLTQASPGDPCFACGAGHLQASKGWALAVENRFDSEEILFALAEAFHDEKGLCLPPPAAPFDVTLMHIPGKTIDTRPDAEALYHSLTEVGLAVLFDDRDERAGVKFNDADLVGAPVRITVGERALQNGMVELKRRRQAEVSQIPLEAVAQAIFQE
jgi:prolyl-tRNA synthetase